MAETAVTYSQTLNGSEIAITLLNCNLKIVISSSGPFLVSRAGDVVSIDIEIRAVLSLFYSL